MGFIKKIVIAVVILLLLSANSIGQTPTYFVWDYPSAELPGISEFQVQYDNGAYFTVGIPTAESLTDTLPNHKSFRNLIPSTLGTGQEHTARVRACNGPTDCSWEPFTTFKFIGPPTNLRIKK